MVSSKEIKELFSKLPAGAQEDLLEDLLCTHELQGKVLVSAKAEVSSKRQKKPCPHCNSSRTQCRGKQKGMQMYRCSECSKWFSDTTGTPLHRIQHKNKWQSYLRCMEQGMPIKKIAKELGISIQTSFDWRHKILSSLNQFVPEKLSNEVECDELELALSNKGSRGLERKPRKRGSDFKRNQGKGENTVVQVVTAVGRDGGKILRAVATKRLSKKDITEALGDKLAEGTTLITDRHRSYKAYAKSTPSIQHKTLLAKNHVDKNDKSIHLQRVNNTHAQLRKFLLPFNGVSSKYLQNYLNWYAYAGEIQKNKKTIQQWLVAVLMADQGYQLFELFKQNAVLIRT